MRLRRRIGLIIGVVLAFATAAPAIASLSQGYATSAPIVSGSLVALDQKSSGSVVVADAVSVSRLFGVVVPPSSASISLSGAAGQVQVATSGAANVLVSTAGGNIKVGDFITVSQIAGVGQKVGDVSTRVIGTAQTDFDGSGEGVTKRSIEDGSGKREVSIGQIPVVIAVAAYSADQGKQPFVVPGWMQRLSNTIAGKDVSPVRVLLAGLIMFTALVCITVLLYAAVRNSIISIGRNPLSRSSVLEGLLQVVLIAAGILALTGGTMYLVITR